MIDEMTQAERDVRNVLTTKLTAQQKNNSSIRSYAFLKRRVELLFLINFRKQVFGLRETFSNFRILISKCKSTRVKKIAKFEMKQNTRVKRMFFRKI